MDKKETPLTALTIADTLDKINDAYQSYLLGKLSAWALADRVGALIVRCERLMQRDSNESAATF